MCAGLQFWTLRLQAVRSRITEPAHSLQMVSVLFCSVLSWLHIWLHFLHIGSYAFKACFFLRLVVLCILHSRQSHVWSGLRMSGFISGSLQMIPFVLFCWAWHCFVLVVCLFVCVLACSIARSLVSWLVWLLSCLLGKLPDCLVGWLAEWFIDCWLIGLLIICLSAGWTVFVCMPYLRCTVSGWYLRCTVSGCVFSSQNAAMRIAHYAKTEYPTSSLQPN